MKEYFLQKGRLKFEHTLRFYFSKLLKYFIFYMTLQNTIFDKI